MKDLEELVCSITKRYIGVFSDHMARSDNTVMYTPDFVIFGLMDRNIALVEAMSALIESKNIHALAPLLRVQLDGLLRLHAFQLVASMDDLAMHMMRGEELRSLKDRSGNKLYDRYLVDSLKSESPWVESMYDKLCSWVHLSDSHIFLAARDGQEEGTVHIGIGGEGQSIPNQLFDQAAMAIERVHAVTS